jgi:D-alanyl-D-alanine dipeptidase
VPLVEIVENMPGLRLDVRYATPDNITGRPIYAEPRVFLREEAARALHAAARLASACGLELVIFDGYRPSGAQMRLWWACPDENYVTPPWKGSAHTRGIAVDLTLAPAGASPFDMGTAFDDMTPRSHPGCLDLPAEVIRRRMLLAGLMVTAGFRPIETEWWHFQLPGDHWPLIDATSLPVRLLANEEK